MPRHRQPGAPRVRVPTRLLAAVVTVLLLTVAVKGFFAQLDHATADPVTVSADAPSPDPTSVASPSPSVTASPSSPPAPSPSVSTARGGVRCVGPGGTAAAAAALQEELIEALATQADQVAVAVHDWTSTLTCSYRGAEEFSAASIVKVATAAAVMQRAERAGRSLTSTERARIRQAITTSDNDAQSRLWSTVGVRGMASFFADTSMTDTVAAPGWGLSTTTAADQLRLLDRLTHGTLLAPDDRDLLLSLMRQVDPTQRWGIRAGAPDGAEVALKNGWYPAPRGWRVHSIGAVSGAGHDYTLAVLSGSHPSLEEGIDVVERIARAVNESLAETA